MATRVGIAAILGSLALATAKPASPEFGHQPKEWPTTPAAPVDIPAVGYKQLLYGTPILDSATTNLLQPWSVNNYYIYGAPAGVGFKVGFCLKMAA